MSPPPNPPSTAAPAAPPMASEPAAKVDVAPTPPAPPEVKPTAEQVKTVEAFNGDWTYEATIIPPGGKPIKAPIGMSCKKIALGKGAACAISETIAGMGPFEGSFLIGFDPFDKTMHFMAVTSDDEIHDHRCKWKDDTNVGCEPLKAGLGGQPVTEELSFSFEKDAATFKSVATMKNGKLVFNGTNGKRGTLPPKKDTGKAKAPKPSAEQKRTVESFAGDWKLEGTITTPDGKTVKAPTSISAAKTALGKGISGLMSGSAEGMGPFEAGFLVGFDPLDKTLHFMAVTTDDEVHDHRCKWKDDKNAVCEPLHAGMNGEPITEDLSFGFEKGSMSFKSIVTMKDGGKMMFEGKGAK
jgi:hypothetical protein